MCSLGWLEWALGCFVLVELYVSTPALLSLRYICSFFPLLSLPDSSGLWRCCSTALPYLRLTAKRELWGTESSDQCACVLQEEEQAAAAVPVPVPAFFAYCWLILHQAPSPLNIHVLQSEQSVQATVHPHIDGYCMTWLQLESYTVLKVSSRTVWKIKACSMPSLCSQPLSHWPKHRRTMGAGGSALIEFRDAFSALQTRLLSWSLILWVLRHLSALLIMLSRHAQLLVPGVVTGWWWWLLFWGSQSLQVHTMPSLSSPCIETQLIMQARYSYDCASVFV